VLSQLDDPGLTALAYQVPRGRRAVTVSITDVTGVGGLVRPGNFVDVFGTFEYGRPVGVEQGVVKYTDERTETRLMLQDVLVLAVGREHRRERPAPRATAGPQTTEQRELEQLREQRSANSTVTMLVEPKQAQELILAQQLGELTFVLRSNLDVGNLANFPTLDPFGLLQMQIPVKKRSTGPAWREMRGTGF
jgi:pilus assembly protein CpaB